MANDLTDARRERVRELWGKSDRRIAETLLEEGYGGPAKRTKDARLQQTESMRRQVHRDREHWREVWREQAKKPGGRTTVDEYVAKLRTRIEDLEEMLDDQFLKGTPRVQALGEIRQIEQAIAKTEGTDIAARDDDDSDTGAPFLGLLLDFSNCSDEVRDRLLKKKPKRNNDDRA